MPHFQATHRAVFAFFFVAGAVVWPAAAQNPVATEKTRAASTKFLIDAKGRIKGVEVADERVAFQSGISIFGPGWDPFYTLKNADNIERQELPDRTIWDGVVNLRNKQRWRYWTMIQKDGRQAVQKVVLEAKTPLDIEAAFLHMRLPVDEFVDGEVILHGLKGQRPKRIILPENRREATHILGSNTTERVTLRLPDSMLELDVILSSPCRVQLQDNRRWHSPFYVLMFRITDKALKSGESAALNLTYRVRGNPDRSPVDLTVKNVVERARFDGVGGNYCFQIDSPQTERTLQDFDVRWARIEASLRDWEPANDNGDSELVNWRHYRSRDEAGSNLRKELNLARRLAARGTQLIASVWDLPEWMYEKQGAAPYTNGRRVPDELWPEVFESLVTYLIHARDKYGVEPRYVSFNEPDAGVCIRIPAAQYNQVMKRLAQCLRKAELKTEVLLGDVSNPRRGMRYLQAMMDSADNLDHFGAVGLHSWGGDSPRGYAAWRALADQLNLPLIVSEAGADSRAWQTQTYNSWYYALQELEMYQKLFLYARPQAVLEWEFTADYPLLIEGDDDAALVPTKRYWLLKHFIELTPVPAVQLDTTSSATNVVMTAFQHTGKGAGQDFVLHRDFAVHIANLGAAREFQLDGLPEWVSGMSGRLTSRHESYRELPVLQVRGGGLRYDLPAQCLLTLLPVPDSAKR